MDSVCEICDIMINEGHVCRDCRKQFESLAKNEFAAELSSECPMCDKYWFPCYICAEHSYGGRLGPGNNGDKKLLSVDDMMDIVNHNNQNHNNNQDHNNQNCNNEINQNHNNEINQDQDCNNEVCDDEIGEKEVIEIIHPTDIKKKNKGYYNSYCSVQ